MFIYVYVSNTNDQTDRVHVAADVSADSSLCPLIPSAVGPKENAHFSADVLITFFRFFFRFTVVLCTSTFSCSLKACARSGIEGLNSVNLIKRRLSSVYLGGRVCVQCLCLCVRVCARGVCV